jgi:hypothetical protein
MVVVRRLNLYVTADFFGFLRKKYLEGIMGNTYKNYKYALFLVILKAGGGGWPEKILMGITNMFLFLIALRLFINFLIYLANKTKTDPYI